MNMRDVAEIEISRAVNDLGYEVTGVIGIDPDAEDAVITVTLKKKNSLTVTLDDGSVITVTGLNKDNVKELHELAEELRDAK